MVINSRRIANAIRLLLITTINSGAAHSYQTRYENVIFAIYDLGHIRDVAEFKGSIERNLNVYVVIVKK